jgi:tryptophan synthase alpha chain
LVAGDPDPASSIEFFRAVAQGGADIIEIGIPYSDPLADGPTIQRASQRALAAGMTFRHALELVARLKERVADVPLIGFTYYNPVLQFGLENTARDFASCGLSGIIVPDLPPMEAAPLLRAFTDRELSVTLLVAPTTPDERAIHIAALCTDFVYVVSRVGVTGADRKFGEQSHKRVERLRLLTDKPLAVGFGVSSPADVSDVARVADGVIVGSALVDRAASARGIQDAAHSLMSFCSELVSKCRRPTVAATPREQSKV